MSFKRYATAAGAVALLMLAACGTTGVYGPNYPDHSRAYAADIHGTVSAVDLNSGSILLTDASGYGPMLSGSGGNTVRVFFDDRTRVGYNGASYSPQDLDRGDQVDVRVRQSGNQLIAEDMTVTYNARAGSGYPAGHYPGNSDNGTYNTTVTGRVTYVDTARHTVTIDRGAGQTFIAEYDRNTPVYSNGRTYSPDTLHRGDRITITGQATGDDRLVARSISVTSGAVDNGNNGGYGNQVSTLRGTVRSIDPGRGTIQLDQAQWIAGFIPEGGHGNVYVTVQFDNATRVDVQGQLYPVTNLEPGDVIEVQAATNSNVPFAQRITLLRNVRR